MNKLRKLNIILIFIVVLIGGSALGFIIIGFATSGSIEDSFTFYHASGSPSPIEQLSLSADIGKLDIKYNTSSTPYLLKVEVSIKIAGLFMVGKSYTNFFTPSTEWWQNTSISTTFDLDVKPDVWFDPSHWFKSYNVTVTATLRTDIIYNLDAMTTTGNIFVDVPEVVAIDDLFLTTTTGNSYLYANGVNLTKGLSCATTTGNQIINLTNCIIGSYISHIGTTGTADIKFYNLEYSEDIVCDIETTTGNINFDIYQYKVMNANITGTVIATTGTIDIVYRDNIASIGARFVGTVTTGNIDYASLGGFEELGTEFSTLNYNFALYKYTFDLSTTTGNINVNGQSNAV